jgi:hypothetical protein
MKKTGVYDESTGYTFFKTFSVPALRKAAGPCVASIFSNFFFRQFRAALLPGRVPVTSVDHPLDRKVPFAPAWVTIYLDFVAFWIRMLAFLLRTYRRKGIEPVREFIDSMGRLYAFASEVYRKNFSTTERPFYIARPRFLLIHLLDPHLMCVPSLHVMVAALTWTRFAAIVRAFGDEERLAAQIEEMKQGALAITQAILFVKQHSVNCVAAALYALTCFDPELLPPEAAEDFTGLLFGKPPERSCKTGANARVHPSASPRTRLPPGDAAAIRAHIIDLYRRFLAAKPDAQNWDEPLLDFLRSPAGPPAGPPPAKG